MMQKLINSVYRSPKSMLKTYRRFGGYFSYRRMLNGERLMKKAAGRLPPSVSFPDGLPLYFLTGENYIHQTLFCIRSLLKASNEPYHFILVDDGSFNKEVSGLIASKLPGSTVITVEQINNNLKKALPAGDFPALHHKRKVYPHIKKITDIHSVSSPGWKLVLDSDMLFWKEPKEITGWLKNPSRPLHMVDCQQSYGYSGELMQMLCGEKIPELVNVGVIGLASADIPWENLETWVSILEQKEGTSYYLEQALTAMLLGETKSTALHREAYKVNPAFSDLQKNVSTLHHYVDLSKAVYFEKAWPLIG
jgi:hypothetical protein